MTTVRFKYFTIITKKPKAFLEALDKLCDQFEEKKGDTSYNFNCED